MPWADAVGAVLYSTMPGQMFGDAISNVLFGDAEPSGRLPISIPNRDNEMNFTVEQYPGVNRHNASQKQDQTVTYSEGLLFGYRYYDAHKLAPKFPFGHGGSYTTFGYAGVAATASAAGGHVSVTATVTNTGPRTGTEVVQLYLQFPAAAGEPPKTLKGFKKITLDAGKPEKLTFSLSPADVSIWSEEAHDWAVQKGTFTAHVGASSRDIRASADFVIS